MASVSELTDGKYTELTYNAAGERIKGEKKKNNNKLITSCITGNAINNTGASYIDIIAKFYDDTGEINIDDLIVSGDSNVSCLWYIRRYDGWMLLDPTELGQNNANIDTDMYKIKRINSYD